MTHAVIYDHYPGIWTELAMLFLQGRRHHRPVHMYQSVTHCAVILQSHWIIENFQTHYKFTELTSYVWPLIKTAFHGA